ncbi:hypothetical protein [Kribbella sp. VKM Ac-2568]|uniref:hypothetical protein n=1 Tax=Kribbella sp. VKM Ac-2568 TaxID=2512219 RepID=UPI00104378BA|nr:hypothetical protein [Kribbella sp. VKM Ac-2568]TCM41126.1 hypothetical protein EV648_112183 [Kribbella sp. VKM Ac-2568]
MRREEVRPLLDRASDLLPEPDLTDTAWAGGLAIRRRRRRSTIVGLAVVLLVALIAAVVAGLGGNNTGIVPPTTPPSTPPGFIPPAGQIFGVDYWMAPPAGSERFLDRLETPLGDALQLPVSAGDLREDPFDRVAAVVLSHRNGSFTPLLLDPTSRWARVDLQLSAIRSGEPLGPGAISPDGRLVAFPQPGGVAIIDATDTTDASTRRVALPAEDIRSVAWLENSDGLLVSGPGVAYRVLIGAFTVGAEQVAPVAASNDPFDVAAPYRLDGTGNQVALMRYEANRTWTVDSNPRLPVGTWAGLTFTQGAIAARMFIADQLPQVPTVVSKPQVVAAISRQLTLPSRLLVLGETPAATPTPGRDTPDRIREPGCCFMLGWYDEQTALLQVAGWVIAWDLQTGRVRRVTELDVTGVALGPGVRG